MPEFILMSPVAFQRLFTLTKWYEETPDEEFGDRFHENVNGLINTIVEEEAPDLDDQLENGEFVAATEINDGKLFISVMTNSDTAKLIEVRSNSF